MSYASGSHTVFRHRYPIVRITKDRSKMLEGALRERIRTMIRQVCKELGVRIVSCVLSREHLHMFVEIPPRIAVSDVVWRVNGRLAPPGHSPTHARSILQRMKKPR